MIGITIGDPTGIGPEVILKSLLKVPKSYLSEIILIGSIDVFRLWSDFYKIGIDFAEFPEVGKGKVSVVDVGIRLKNLDISEEEASRVALLSIDKSIELIKSDVIKGVVNAPVSKARISRITQEFRGHTGYYANAFGIREYNMAFYSRDFRIVLLTDHIPLKEVPNKISEHSLKTTIINTYRWIKSLDDDVKIGICGLNPHAGENGVIGNEEDVIKKVISEFEFEIYGPLPPDTAFIEYKRKKLNCLICLYHDQGLIGFKLLHFEDGVNVTIGIPFIRSSPDHGTAFNIVGKGVANPMSMLEAIKYALRVESKINGNR